MSWPWPDHDVHRYVVKARKAMDGYPRGDELADRFLRRLAARGVAPDCGCPRRLCRLREPVTDLGDWCRAHTSAEVISHIASVDSHGLGRILDAERWAARLAGWRIRRHDFNVRRRKTRRWTWLGVRTK